MSAVTQRFGHPPTRQTHQLPPAHGRHGRAGAARRALHTMPRPTARGALAVAGLAELAAAIGWTAGYGPSASTAVAAFNSAFLLILAAVKS
ncbi:hypothetical protein Ssi03_62000 [Sphaerisporangium siamense]|uniref:Uncharacterized protein n=1 Tax=Sphaerisporangium siamense TaxID=795645 RepID=A0A7W7D9I0_9ACTN|nr:hypothetical protein [Sphaerisporangium siamense]MBB4702511.1 hypothetical protein [Sphaerisporangium siamense]GII88210.1 hypothetical protein Ssi03_62000 [Sphaerisporangium siamense]